MLTIEDGTLSGGLFGAVSEIAVSRADNPAEGLAVKVPKITGLGIPDEFIEQDTQAGQKRYCSLDADSIFEKLKSLQNDFYFQ